MSGHSKAGDVIHLELYIGVNQIVAEDAAGFQEIPILVESAQGFIQRKRNELELFLFLRGQVLEIFVHSVARVGLVLNAVQAGQHHGCKHEVRIRHRVRETNFDAPALWVRIVRDTN